MLGLINRTVEKRGSRVMGWCLVLLVNNYVVISNGSNVRWSSLYKEQTILFDTLI